MCRRFDPVFDILGIEHDHFWVQYSAAHPHLFSDRVPPSPGILGFHPANEKRRYKVTLSLIGWAQT